MPLTESGEKAHPVSGGDRFFRGVAAIRQANSLKIIDKNIEDTLINSLSDVRKSLVVR